MRNRLISARIPHQSKIEIFDSFSPGEAMAAALLGAINDHLPNPSAIGLGVEIFPCHIEKINENNSHLAIDKCNMPCYNSVVNKNRSQTGGAYGTTPPETFPQAGRDPELSAADYGTSQR